MPETDSPRGAPPWGRTPPPLCQHALCRFGRALRLLRRYPEQAARPLPLQPPALLPPEQRWTFSYVAPTYLAAFLLHEGLHQPHEDLLTAAQTKAAADGVAIDPAPLAMNIAATSTAWLDHDDGTCNVVTVRASTASATEIHVRLVFRRLDAKTVGASRS